MLILFHAGASGATVILQNDVCTFISMSFKFPVGLYFSICLEYSIYIEIEHFMLFRIHSVAAAFLMASCHLFALIYILPASKTQQLLSAYFRINKQ